MYYRALPLDLRLCRPSCDIDDNSRRDCNAYLRCIAKWSQCVVDIKFGYTIINEGPACVDIKDFKDKLGPYPMSTRAFDNRLCLFHIGGTVRWIQSGCELSYAGLPI